MQLEYKRDLNHSYMIVREKAEPNVASYQIRMLQTNSIPGLLQCRMQKMDNQTLFYYDITSKQALNTLYERKKIDAVTLRELFWQILNLLESLGKYLLDQEGLVLTPETVYLTQEPLLFEFCYLPGRKKMLEEQMRELMEYLLPKMEHQDQQTVVLGYGIYRVLTETAFSVENLKAVLMRECQRMTEKPTEEPFFEEEKQIAQNEQEETRRKAMEAFFEEEQEEGNEGLASTAAMIVGSVIILALFLLLLYANGVPVTAYGVVLAVGGVFVIAAACIMRFRENVNRREETGEQENVQREYVHEIKTEGKNADRRYTCKENTANGMNVYGEAFNKPTPYGENSGRAAPYGENINRTASYGEPFNRTSPYGENTNRAASYGEPFNRTSPYGEPFNRTSSYGENATRAASYEEPFNRTSPYGENTDRATSYGETFNRASSYGENANGATVDRETANEADTYKENVSGSGYGETAGRTSVHEKSTNRKQTHKRIARRGETGFGDSRRQPGWKADAHVSLFGNPKEEEELSFEAAQDESTERSECSTMRGVMDIEQGENDRYERETTGQSDNRKQHWEKKGISEELLYQKTEPMCLQEQSGTAVLVAADEKGPEEIVLAEEETTLGKLQTAVDVVLPFQTVSRIHARIRATQDGYFIMDLNSMNGTRINGELLSGGKEQKLEEGDEITFAELKYHFHKFN